MYNETRGLVNIIVRGYAVMDDIEEKLIAYLKASQNARRVLSELYGLEINGPDIQDALAEVLQIQGNPPLGILDKNLTDEIIIDLLKDYDFTKFHPEILAEVTLEESLLPAHVKRLLTERTIKVKGEVWRVHKTDADSFPSMPHAHNCESGVKLHLGTGEIFDKNRKTLGKIGCKKLLRIRSELRSVTLPATDCT